MARECDRFNQARKHRSGIQVSCDIYVPLSPGGNLPSHRIDFRGEEKERLKQILTEILRDVKDRIKELDGIMQVRQVV